MSKIKDNHKPFKDIEFKSLIIAFKGMLIIFFIVVSLILIFSIKSVAISQDLDYTFENDYIYNSDDIDYTTFNLRNSSIYTENYNATYSFENEVGLINSEISWNNGGIEGTDFPYQASIIASNEHHNDIMYFYAEGNDGTYIYWQHNPSHQISGIIELWAKYIDYGQGNMSFYFKNTDVGNLWYSNFNSNDNRLYSSYGNGIGGHSSLSVSASSNTWYHLKWSWNCITDKYSMWVNKVLLVNNENFYDDLDGSILTNYSVQLDDGGGSNYLEGYVDAIGHSWDNSGIYNATYSFDNEVDLEGIEIEYVDYYNDDVNCSVIVISEKDNHNDVLKLNDSSNTKYIYIYNTIEPIQKGISEFWIQIDSVSHLTSFQYRIVDGSDIAVQLQWNFAKLQYFASGSWNDISGCGGLLPNTWYHWKIDFDCNSNTFNFSLNYILKDYDLSFRGARDTVNQISIYSSSSDNPISYIDAIGYSWDSNYTIGQNLYLTEIYYNINDNIIPLLDYQESTYEIDKCEFAYNISTLEPNGLDKKNIDNNWNEYDDGTNSHVKTDGADDGIIIGYYMTQDQDEYGIYKEFDYNNNGIFNISFDITSMSLFNPQLDGWYFNIYSYDDTLLVSLLFNSSLILLSYYNGSSYIYLHNIQNSLGSFSFNIYIDNFVVLRLNDNDVNYQWYLPELTDNIGINTIEVIGGDNDDIGDYADVFIDAIGLYINGSSYLPDDLSSIIINTDIEYWNENIHNIFEINADGYFSFSIYYNNIYWYNLFSYDFFDNENKRIIEYGLDIFKGYSPYSFVLVSNVSFTISKIMVYGNSLKENSNVYYPSFTYSGVDIQENYFYIESNRLYFIHDSDNTEVLEYIQVSFNINNEYCLNASINYNTKFIGISKGYFLLEYISSLIDVFEMPLSTENINIILPQEQIISKFTFLITDNNNSEYLGNSEGYFSSIKLNFIPNIEITLLTITLIEIMIPLMVLILPSIVISGILGKKAIIPMLILMTIICYIADLIELGLFTIIMMCLGSLIIVQYKIKKD